MWMERGMVLVKPELKQDCRAKSKISDKKSPNILTGLKKPFCAGKLFT